MKKISLDSLWGFNEIILSIVLLLVISVVSIIWKVTFAETVPLAPTNLTSSQTSTSISLSWTDNATNEDRYSVQRKLTTATDWSPNNAVSFLISQADATSYTDSTVTPGATYDYKVSACLTGTGCSEGTFVVGVATLGSTVANIPAVPSNLNFGTPTSYSVPLSWTDNSTNEDKFIIERKLSSTTIWSTVTQVSQANVTSYTDSLVTPGNYYSYRIQACLSGTGCSDYSYTSNSVYTPLLLLPSTPTNLSIDGGITTTSVHLKWTDNAVNEDKFNIERKQVGTNTWVVTQISTPNITTFTDTSIVSGNTYDYRLQACLSGTGCSDFIYLYGISVPTNTTNNSGTGTGTTSSTTSSTTTTTTTTVPSLSNTGLSTTTTTTNGATASGTTANNLPTATTTNSTIATPLSPSGLSLYTTTTPSYIPLVWRDNATNEDKFNIERKLNNVSAWTFLTQLIGANITRFTDTSVTPGYTYDYRVQACLSGTGCSGYATLSGITIPNMVAVRPTSTVSTIIPSTDTTQTSGVTNNLTTPISPPRATSQPIKTNVATATEVKTTNPLPQPVIIATSTIISSVIPQAVVVTVSTSTVATTTIFSAKVEDLGLIVEQRKNVVLDAKTQLVKLIIESVDSIIFVADSEGKKIDREKIFSSRDELLKKVDSSLLYLTTITPQDVDNLKNEVNKGIGNIRLMVGDSSKEQGTIIGNTTVIASALNVLSQTVNSQSEKLKKQDADLLYKDTNKDGISDYDSVHVYNMDPKKTSPTTNYEGKVLKASDKILLGFDPTKKELVKVKVEEPATSTAPIVSTFKVKEVSITENKNVVIKGQALPNSFVTVYIYSTPITVTVKANSQGEWQYTLDKELEDGNHTIYTATVNNSGNIIAKSPGFLFAKTAEAVTVSNVPTISATATNKPSLFGGNNLYFVAVILMLIGAILILMGMNYKKEKEDVDVSVQ